MNKDNVYYVVLNTENNLSKGLEYGETTVQPQNDVDYKTMFMVDDGTSYNIETPNEVVIILERAKRNRTRLILDYGDNVTGHSWGEIHCTTGYIGRSTGKRKIPLLVFNSRSFGGSSILDHKIVKIIESKGKNVLYKHPNYHV